MEALTLRGVSNVQRIMVIGCCGCGKTTLSKKLASKLNLPLVHLDVLNWRDNWQPVSQGEFDRLLLGEVKKDKWVIDGNYHRTIPIRLKYCDTVIYMDYPRVVCLLGAIKRILKGYGKSRSDMGGNCPERLDMEFLRFIWNFNKNNRKNYLEMLEEAAGKKKVIVLHGRKECLRFLQSF